MINEHWAKKYCCEDISLIENYDKAANDKDNRWVCHHRLELRVTGAVVESTKQDLIDWGIYYKRPADELIFLTQFEHHQIHKKGRKFSEEHRRKIGEANRRRIVTEETKRKISESKKGRKMSDEFKRKISERTSGKKNPMYGKHHSEETRKKMSKLAKLRYSKREEY